MYARYHILLPFTIFLHYTLADYIFHYVETMLTQSLYLITVQ